MKASSRTLFVFKKAFYKVKASGQQHSLNIFRQPSTLDIIETNCTILQTSDTEICMEAEKRQAIKLIFKWIYFFEKLFYMFQIDLYLSNRFQFFKSAFQIGLYFSNRFSSFKWIYIVQIPLLNRFIFFKSIYPAGMDASQIHL